MSKPEGRRRRRGCPCRQPWIHLVRLIMLTVSFVFSYLYLYQHSWLLRPTHPLVLFEAISTTSHGYALAISSWWWEGTCSLSSSLFQGKCKCRYKYKYLVSEGFLAALFVSRQNTNMHLVWEGILRQRCWSGYSSLELPRRVCCRSAAWTTWIIIVQD